MRHFALRLDVLLAAGHRISMSSVCVVPPTVFHVAEVFFVRRPSPNHLNDLTAYRYDSDAQITGTFDFVYWPRTGLLTCQDTPLNRQDLLPQVAKHGLKLLVLEGDLDDTLC